MFGVQFGDIKGIYVHDDLLFTGSHPSRSQDKVIEPVSSLDVCTMKMICREHEIKIDEQQNIQHRS